MWSHFDEPAQTPTADVKYAFLRTSIATSMRPRVRKLKCAMAHS